MGFLSFCHWHPKTGTQPPPPPRQDDGLRDALTRHIYSSHTSLHVVDEETLFLTFLCKGMMSMHVNGFLVPAARYPKDFVIQIWSNSSAVNPQMVMYAGNWPWFYHYFQVGKFDENLKSWLQFWIKFISIYYIFNWSLYQHIPSFFMNILGFRKKKTCDDKTWGSITMAIMTFQGDGIERISEDAGHTGRRWLVGCAIPKGNDFQVRTVSFREGTYIKAGCSKWLGK